MVFGTIYGQNKEYHTVIMKYQIYSNGVPGKEIATSERDTILLGPESVSITHFVHNYDNTSALKVTSLQNGVYTCKINDFDSYKIYIEDKWIVVDRYAGDELFARRKYLISID